jgi:hypothetical protein
VFRHIGAGGTAGIAAAGGKGSWGYWIHIADFRKMGLLAADYSTEGCADGEQEVSAELELSDPAPAERGDRRVGAAMLRLLPVHVVGRLVVAAALDGAGAWLCRLQPRGVWPTVAVADGVGPRCLQLDVLSRWRVWSTVRRQPPRQRSLRRRPVRSRRGERSRTASARCQHAAERCRIERTRPIIALTTLAAPGLHQQSLLGRLDPFRGDRQVQ